MPAKHTSFPNGPRVYGLTAGRRIRLTRELVLDSDYFYKLRRVIGSEANLASVNPFQCLDRTSLGR